MGGAYGSHGLEILPYRQRRRLGGRAASPAAPSSSSSAFRVPGASPNAAGAWSNPSMMPHDRDAEVRRLLERQN